MGKHENEIKKDEKVRLMPVLHSDKYVPALSTVQLTAEEKVKFLENYYKTGNMTKSAKAIGRDIHAFRHHLQKDEVFALDFHNVKIAIKNDLEEVMLENALKDRGFMDRMAWLRTNFPQEYNPNSLKDGENKNQEVLKQLSQKLSEYELIPKKNVIEESTDAT